MAKLSAMKAAHPAASREADRVLTGGCHCRAVRYEAEGPARHETLCHCSICRRTTGAPAVAWVTVAAATFRFVCGEPTRYRSTRGGTRSFCPRCGTQLTFQLDALRKEMDLTTASLDDPERYPPKDHTYTASRLGWMTSADTLPAYPGAREGQEAAHRDD